MKHKSKTNKRAIVVLVISSILLIIGLFVGFVVTTFTEDFTEQNTTFIKSTVQNVKIKKGAENNSFVLITEEYPKVELFIIYNTIIDENTLQNIQVGQEVVFGIPQVSFSGFEDMGFCYLVYLKTQDKEIITLDSYNKCVNISDQNIKITACVFSAIFFVLDAYCVFIICRNVKKRAYQNKNIDSVP